MNSADPHPSVKGCLEKFGLQHRVFQCEPEWADTAVFCEKYGFAPEITSNTIITASKADPIKFAASVILATTKLDVNKKICQLTGVKRASFANAEQTLELTGMQIGGVTPFGLPDIPLFIDALLMKASQLVLGGGNRTTKIILLPEELLKLPNAQVVEGLAMPR